MTSGAGTWEDGFSFEIGTPPKVFLISTTCPPLINPEDASLASIARQAGQDLLVAPEDGSFYKVSARRLSLVPRAPPISRHRWRSYLSQGMLPCLSVEKQARAWVLHRQPDPPVLPTAEEERAYQ